MSAFLPEVVNSTVHEVAHLLLPDVIGSPPICRRSISSRNSEPLGANFSAFVSRMRQCVLPHTLYFVCFARKRFVWPLAGLVHTLLLNLQRRVHNL